MSSTNISPVKETKEVVYTSRYSSSPLRSSITTYRTSYPYSSTTVYRTSYSPPRTYEYTEYKPIERKVIDYVSENNEIRPVEKTTTDYVEVKHSTTYEPTTRIERTEYLPPIDHIDTITTYTTDYYPRYYPSYYSSYYPYYSRYALDLEYPSTSVVTSTVRTSNYYPYTSTVSRVRSYSSYKY